MAYIPPHKRHSKDNGRPAPVPELLVPLFKKNLNFRSPDSKIARSGKIVYAEHSKYRWFAVGLDDSDQFPSSVHLEPISLECGDCNDEKPLMLVNSNVPEENTKRMGNISRTPWVTTAEIVQQGLLSSFEMLRNEMEHQGLEKVKPILVARFGKIHFRGSHSMRLGDVNREQVAEHILRRLKRSFYTNIPSSYMENIINRVIPEMGMDFEEVKDTYHVKLSDSTQPDATVSCKCSLTADRKLLLYKVELNQVRQMVDDVSCLDKNLDLRIMLCTKRILTALTDDEMNSIRELINSAVVDSDVKGGLRWPMEASSGDRYNIAGVWHTTHEAYKNSSLRLKVRHADRYDFRSGTGESTREVYLKLKGILSELLQEQRAESDSVSNMLEDTLRLIWEKFLCCEPF